MYRVLLFYNRVCIVSIFAKHDVFVYDVPKFNLSHCPISIKCQLVYSTNATFSKCHYLSYILNYKYLKS